MDKGALISVSSPPRAHSDGKNRQARSGSVPVAVSIRTKGVRCRDGSRCNRLTQGYRASFTHRQGGSDYGDLVKGASFRDFACRASASSSSRTPYRSIPRRRTETKFSLRCTRWTPKLPEPVQGRCEKNTKNSPPQPFRGKSTICRRHSEGAGSSETDTYDGHGECSW